MQILPFLFPAPVPLSFRTKGWPEREHDVASSRGPHNKRCWAMRWGAVELRNNIHLQILRMTVTSRENCQGLDSRLMVASGERKRKRTDPP